jgi:hypothetical protein
MATSIGFFLSSVIAAGIIFIGGRFLLAPSLAAAGYGVPAGTEPHLRAYLFAKGIRDIASGPVRGHSHSLRIRTPARLVYAGCHHHTHQ